MIEQSNSTISSGGGTGKKMIGGGSKIGSSANRSQSAVKTSNTKSVQGL